MENPINMDDLGVPLFLEILMFLIHISHYLCHCQKCKPPKPLDSFVEISTDVKSSEKESVDNHNLQAMLQFTSSHNGKITWDFSMNGQDQ